MSKYTALLLERADILTRGQLVHSDHLLTPSPTVPASKHRREGSLTAQLGWSARATVPAPHLTPGQCWEVLCKMRRQTGEGGVSINMNHFSSPETHYSLSLTVPNTTCFELRALFVFYVFIFN